MLAVVYVQIRRRPDARDACHFLAGKWISSNTGADQASLVVRRLLQLGHDAGRPRSRDEARWPAPCAWVRVDRYRDGQFRRSATSVRVVPVLPYAVAVD
jgi:hypothetical protein